MQSEDFVEAIKIAVRNSAISGTLRLLEDVPGRKPNIDLIEMSQWFNKLNTQDREMLERIVRVAVEQAVFGFFAVLDGDRAVENNANKGDLELYYVKGGEQVCLNDPTNPLHDIFNTRV